MSKPIIPCCWPDLEAPYDFDDPPVCRRPAVKLVRITGAKNGLPSCQSCADAAVKDNKPGDIEVVDIP